MVRRSRLERDLRGGRDRPPPARQPLSTKSGRAWINGREVGGTNPAFAHLDRSYD
jgi:hypothetical protein